MMILYTLMNGVAILTCRLMLLSMGLSSQYLSASLVLLLLIFVLELLLSIMIMYEIKEFTQPTINGNNNDIIL